MEHKHEVEVIAFCGVQCIGSGELARAVTKAKAAFDRDPGAPIMIFDAVTSKRVEIDLGGTKEDVLQRLPKPKQEPAASASESRGPGRPKLGVVAREVTLLPRHWDWLNSQPGGASVALRKLVEEARRLSLPRDRARQSQESLYRFMSAMAGDFPGYEEALRALYRIDSEQFIKLIHSWPKDIREHVSALAQTAFSDQKIAEIQ